MKIETERLIITEFTKDMAEDLHKNSLDEDNRKFVPDEVFETVEDAEKLLEYLMSRYDSEEGPFVYPVITKTGQNVGYVQLCGIPEGWEVGYHIAKAYTGIGYATEAVKAFIPYIAKERKISQISGIYLEENQASGKVLERCGFKTYFSGEGDYQGKTRRIVKTMWEE